MGPIEAQQPSFLERTREKDEEVEPIQPTIPGCLKTEISGSVWSPLESTRLDGSFQADWAEPFELITNPEAQFEDYGEVVSPCSIRSSYSRHQDSRRNSCDLSVMDPEESSSSESIEKLSFLEDRILELEGEKSQHEETEKKLRQINKELVKRVYSLEEQIQDEKIRQEEEKMELLAQKEASFQKAERKWRLEMDKLNARLKLLQEDNAQLSQSVSSLQTQNRVLDKKVQSLVNEVLETAESLEKERERNKMWEESLTQERAAWESERQEVAQLVENLRGEMTRLRRASCEVHCCDDQDCTQNQWEECEREKQRLAEENRSLLDMNEELQDALLLQTGSLCFPHRVSRENSPSKEGSPVHSIAEEIDVCAKEQLSALNEQKEINRRLRQYLDRVILSVLEKDPSLLEIKSTI